MTRYSISKLAGAFGLSRSTLLYYDRIGLLPPSGRLASGYRYYSKKDYQRLERVCHFRQAGLTLSEIRAVLTSGGKPGARLLEKKLNETAENLLDLRIKQRLLAGMLSRIASGASSPPVDKEMWVEMLRAAGMDDNAMARWHTEFERRSPQGHHEFLVSLDIPQRDILRIREWSRAAAAKEDPGTPATDAGP